MQELLKYAKNSNVCFVALLHPCLLNIKFSGERHLLKWNVKALGPLACMCVEVRIVPGEDRKDVTQPGIFTFIYNSK